MNKFLKSNLLIIIGVILGLIGGYLYYRYVGCSNGCPLTSSPWTSSAWGGLMGGLLFSLFKKNKK